MPRVKFDTAVTGHHALNRESTAIVAVAVVARHRRLGSLHLADTAAGYIYFKKTIRVKAETFVYTRHF